MKIGLSQLNFLIGDFEKNLGKIKKAIHRGKDLNVDLLVFSELSVCGYPPRDFLEFNDFIQRCKKVIREVAKLTDDIGVILGTPTINPVTEGKDLYNSAVLIYKGEVIHTQHKTLLPTYDIFDEYRYFEPATEWNVVEFMGKRLAITVCEDIWNIGNENPLYTICPMDEMIKQSPDIMINISASPFDYNHAEERINICKENVKKYGIPLIYVNQVGANTEVIFDGGSLVLDKTGHVLDEMPYFKESLTVHDTAVMEGDQNFHRNNERPKEKIKLIHDALILGIQDYFGKLGFKKAILGLSGGIDSAVTLALAAEALGAENVKSILLPSRYSSDHSINDSVEMCHILDTPYDIIGIHQMYESALLTMKAQLEDTEFNVTEENLQARIRGQILMAMSNKFGYILLNTSNKSEAAVGYGTLYGDMCGGLSAIGDLYKIEVFELAEYINRETEIIPRNIITKPPSAELRPDQKDSDSLPEYDILDRILNLYIDERKGPKEIIKLGFDKTLVQRILRLVNLSEYKRYQTPPMLRISSKAFGMGRRMPIVGRYLS